MIFKICGLKEKDSILCCEANNVDFFGLIFYEQSPRNIAFKDAKELVNFSLNKGIPIGANIESVSIRKDEIDASVELLENVKDILNKNL